MYLIVLYVIGGVLALVMAITSWIAIMKIWRLVHEVIESGAIPIILMKRARKAADEMLKAGVIYDHKKLERIRQVLTEIDGSQEAARVISQLDELEERNKNHA